MLKTSASMLPAPQTGTAGAKAGVRIAVAGSVNMDLVFRTPRMPLAGETLSGHSYACIPGGKGANQAVAAARLGAQVSLIGRLGDDAHAATLRAGLIADGIDTSQLGCAAGMASGIAAILVDDAGRNSIVVTSGANLSVSPAHIEAAAPLITAADLLLCQLEIPLASVVRAIEIARSAGRRVLFNPAPVLPLPEGLLAMVDYLVVNEHEAAQLSGVEVDGVPAAEHAAARLLASDVGVVLLTMGALGVLVASRDGMTFLPAIAVDAVDTTAAGDTFVGAFAVALTEGMVARDAAARAQYAAALSVTRAGAQSSIPDRQQVQLFIAARLAGG